MSWGKVLAEEKGFGSNFSAYIADLIRRDNDHAEKNKRPVLVNHNRDHNRDGADGPVASATNS